MSLTGCGGNSNEAKNGETAAATSRAEAKNEGEIELTMMGGAHLVSVAEIVLRDYLAEHPNAVSYTHLILVTPVSLFVASFIARRTYTMFRKQSQTRGELTSLVEEMLGSQKVVLAFGHEKEAQAQFEEINERLRVWGLKATFFSSITNPATRFVNSLDVYKRQALYSACRGRPTRWRRLP